MTRVDAGAWRRTGAALLGAISLFWVWPAAGAEPTVDLAPAEFAGEILLAEYQATAYNRAQSGAVLWLAGPDGALRLEIGLAEDGAGSGPEGDRSDQLLNRTGRGWTVVLTGTDTGTLNAWGREWQPAPAGLGAALRRVGAVLFGESAPAARPAGRPWRAGRGGAAVQREPVGRLFGLRDATGVARLRDELTRRGRGRGGQAEMLAWRWISGPQAAAEVLEVWATGRPGSARLHQKGRFQAICANPETFVPLWPLAELIRPATETGK